MLWDAELFELLNRSLTHPWLDRILPLVTSSATWRVPVAAAALLTALFGSPRTRRTLLGLALCVALADVVSSRICKPLVGRLRPSFVLPEVRLLIGPKGSFSFPSSHAANLAAATWFLHRTVRRRSLTAGMLLVLVGISYSRIYVGVHYPSDILGGACLGLLVAELCVQTRQSRRTPPEPGVAGRGESRSESVTQQGGPLAHPPDSAEPAVPDGRGPA